MLRPALVGVVLAAVAACGALVSTLAAQQPRVRLNRIIEQFEQGLPSFANEHWHFFTLTNNPFLIDDLEQLLADLRPEGSSRPRLTPIVRIPYWGDQEYKHMIKQFLGVGVMGIIVPEVEMREQALRLVQRLRYPRRNAERSIPMPATVAAVLGMLHATGGSLGSST